MALELQYNKALRDLSNVSPEVRAVRSPDTLLGAYGRAATQQKIAEDQSAMNIQGMQARVNMQRQDLRDKRRDFGMALPVTIAGMGVNALGTYETRQAEKEREQKAQEQNEKWETIYNIRLRHYDEIEKILSGESESTPASQPSNTYITQPNAEY
jgi:hypothetical protein